jgi:hypothetical protein
VDEDQTVDDQQVDDEPEDGTAPGVPRRQGREASPERQEAREREQPEEVDG